MSHFQFSLRCTDVFGCQLDSNLSQGDKAVEPNISILKFQSCLYAFEKDTSEDFSPVEHWRLQKAKQFSNSLAILEAKKFQHQTDPVDCYTGEWTSSIFFGQNFQGSPHPSLPLQ